MSFKVYIIKCLKTDKCYISYTASKRDDYNPIRYLHSLYEKDKSKYTLLGESIDEHGFKEHKYAFIKTELNQEEASKLTNEYREKLKDRSLHVEVKKDNYFEEELKLLL